MINLKENKGITLIALIITIIVLLILAAVVIASLTGENGLLGRASSAKINSCHSTIKEQIILEASEYKIDKITRKYTDGFIKYLEDNNDIEDVSDYYRIKTENISNGKLDFGKGKTKEKGDIYVIEESENSEYTIKYYDESGEKTDLLEINDNGDTKDVKNDNTSQDTPTDDIPDDGIIENGDVNLTYIEDLLAFRDNVNSGTDYSGKLVAIKNSLDINSDSSYRSTGDELTALKSSLQAGNYVPIGTETHPFNGTFTGNNYTISNLAIDDSKNENISDKLGLFGYNSGTIKKIKVENIKIESYNDDAIIGGVVAKNNSIGIVQNCKNLGVENNGNIAVSSGMIFAGIVGVNDGTIRLCVNKMSCGRENGGIVAINNGLVEECMNSGVENNSIWEYGGIANINNGTILNCKNTMNFTGSLIGGIVYENHGTVKNCENGGNIRCNESYGECYVSGIIAKNVDEKNLKIENCINRGNIISEGSYSAGIIGFSDYTTTYTTTIDNCKNYGEIRGNDYCAGIVGITYADKIEIRNCTNEGSVSGNTDIGGIMGNAYRNGDAESIFQNCENKGNITYYNTGAGIIGNTYKSTISNCLNSGNISYIENQTNNTYYTGGIVARGEILNLTNCINSGKISGILGEVGGIIGYVDDETSTIIQCWNSGEISQKTDDYDESVGGIVGKCYSEGIRINKCYNTGRVAGVQNVGGIIGYAYGRPYISNSYNTGNISGDKSIGGIGGYGSVYTADNLFNIGSVSGKDMVGGLLGDSNAYEMKNVFSSSNITLTDASGNMGIIFGCTQNTDNMTKIYYELAEGKNAVGLFEPGASNPEQVELIEKTQSEMKNQSFVDLLNTNKGTNESWKLDSVTGYPTLDFTISIN